MKLVQRTITTLFLLSCLAMALAVLADKMM